MPLHDGRASPLSSRGVALSSIAALLVLAPAAVRAQVATAGPDVGTRVRVTLVSPQMSRPRSFRDLGRTAPVAPPLVGRVTATETDVLGVSTRYRTWTMPWSAVETLEVSHVLPRRVAALRGFGTGFVIGGLTEATTGFPGVDRSRWTPRGALTMGAIGMVAGMLLGTEEWERVVVPAR